MLDQGYGDGDLSLRLHQLKFYLRAVVNAILDHKMHCTPMTDDEALKAFSLLCKLEGIIPALESSHAVAEVIKRAPRMRRDQILLVNLSGRGDKDLDTVMKELQQ